MKTKMFVLITVVCASLAIASNATAKIIGGFSWLSFEATLSEISTGGKLTDCYVVGCVPVQYRTIPTHPDDPYLELDPLADESPFDLPVWNETFNLFRVRVWLFSTISIGAGMKLSGPDLKLTGAYYSGTFDETILHRVRYNYGREYHPYWGSTYIWYGIGVGQYKPRWFDYNFEAKTPAFLIWHREGIRAKFHLNSLGQIRYTDRGQQEEWVGVRLYAGWQPSWNRKMIVTALNGWERYGGAQLRESYVLGEFSYDLVYGGVMLELGGEEGEFGIKFFVAQDRVTSKITEVGHEFGLEVKEFPLMFGFALYGDFSIF